MGQIYPRIVAGTGSLIGILGVLASLPLLSAVDTALFFLFGLVAWVFLSWRAACRSAREEFLLGWIWSAVLHLSLLPIAPMLGPMLGTWLPVPGLILSMFLLSIAGLLFDLHLSAVQEN